MSRWPIAWVLDAALRVVGRLLPLEPDRRREVVSDARRLARERGSGPALLELGSLALLVVELRGAPTGADRRSVGRAVRRGARLGAEVLLVQAVVLVAVVARTTGPGPPAPSGLALRVPGCWSLLAVGVPALIVGRSQRIPLGSRVGLWLVTGLVVGGAGLMGGPEGAALAGRTSVLVVVVVLLAGSRADPGLGGAGAVLALWRFVVVDPSGLGELAVALARTGPDSDLVLRGLAMVAGLTAAVAVAHRSLRQAATT